MLGYNEDIPSQFHYVEFLEISEINEIIKSDSVDCILSIALCPKDDEKIGLKEIKLDDGRQAFELGKPYDWQPSVSFRTIQDIIDCKNCKTEYEIKKQWYFMEGKQYY